MVTMLELARLEEGRLAVSIAEVATESRRIPEQLGGGVLCRGAPGVWTNVAVGLGLGGPVAPEVADTIIEWHSAVGAEPRVEVSPVAHPSLLEALGARSFVLRAFENVFFRGLERGQHTTAPAPLGDGIDISTVDPAREHDLEECARASAAGFAHPRPPTPAEVDLVKLVIRHPRTVTLAARSNGQVVGTGWFETFGDLAALFGVSVRPEFRRRGIQQALIARRLDMAAERGSRLATISARPGVATEPNARRMGFILGYTKVVVVHPGPGLAPVST